MDMRKYEISSVDQDISLVRFAHLWDLFLFNTRNNFIFPYIHALFYLSYKKIVLLPHKNKAVNSNAFHDYRHIIMKRLWDYDQ